MAMQPKPLKACTICHVPLWSPSKKSLISKLFIGNTCHSML
ncbi:hypothetical protein [Moraxella haemolytica]|nr:hypothetical protein [Moraxella sp. ZY171148]